VISAEDRGSSRKVSQGLSGRKKGNMERGREDHCRNGVHNQRVDRTGSLRQEGRQR
jgi:hypothetical protein